MVPRNIGLSLENQSLETHNIITSIYYYVMEVISYKLLCFSFALCNRTVLMAVSTYFCRFLNIPFSSCNIESDV